MAGRSSRARHCASTADVIANLQTLTRWRRCQPVGLAAIAAVSQADPDITQIACFDTAFHTTQDPLGARFAIAQRWHDRRRAPLQLSWAVLWAIAHRLPWRGRPRAGRGAGGGAASGQRLVACILHRRQSVANSTGMSAGGRPDDGHPPRQSRPGSGVVVDGKRRHGHRRRAPRVVQGQRAVGRVGISADMRELLASSGIAAALAVELYCYRAARVKSARWRCRPAAWTRWCSPRHRPAQRASAGRKSSPAWPGWVLTSTRGQRRQRRAHHPRRQPPVGLGDRHRRRRGKWRAKPLRCWPRVKSRSQPLALLCDLVVLLVLSAVTRLARAASLGFVSDAKSDRQAIPNRVVWGVLYAKTPREASPWRFCVCGRCRSGKHQPLIGLPT